MQYTDRSSKHTKQLPSLQHSPLWSHDAANYGMILMTDKIDQIPVNFISTTEDDKQCNTAG